MFFPYNLNSYIKFYQSLFFFAGSNLKYLIRSRSTSCILFVTFAELYVRRLITKFCSGDKFWQCSRLLASTNEFKVLFMILPPAAQAVPCHMAVGCGSLRACESVIDREAYAVWSVGASSRISRVRRTGGTRPGDRRPAPGEATACAWRCHRSRSGFPLYSVSHRYARQTTPSNPKYCSQIARRHISSSMRKTQSNIDAATKNTCMRKHLDSLHN